MDKGTHSIIYHHRICKHICIKVNMLYMKFCVNFISSITIFLLFRKKCLWIRISDFTDYKKFSEIVICISIQFCPEIGKLEYQIISPWPGIIATEKIKENSSYMYVLIHQNNSIDFKIKSCFYKIKNDINLWKDSKHINYYIIQTSQSTCKWRNRDDAVVICACNNIN